MSPDWTCLNDNRLDEVPKQPMDLRVSQASPRQPNQGTIGPHRYTLLLRAAAQVMLRVRAAATATQRRQTELSRSLVRRSWT